MSLDVAAARNTDPDTSKAAAKSVKPYAYCMLLLSQFARRSSTAEAASIGAGSIPGYWKRVSDLRNAGYIRVRVDRHGKAMKDRQRSGRMALVWQITDEGREALRLYRSQHWAA